MLSLLIDFCSFVNGFDAQTQLFHAEWQCDEVVGPDIEGLDDIALMRVGA